MRDEKETAVCAHEDRLSIHRRNVKRRINKNIIFYKKHIITMYITQIDPIIIIL